MQTMTNLQIKHSFFGAAVLSPVLWPIMTFATWLNWPNRLLDIFLAILALTEHEYNGVAYWKKMWEFSTVRYDAPRSETIKRLFCIRQYTIIRVTYYRVTYQQACSVNWHTKHKCTWVSLYLFNSLNMFPKWPYCSKNTSSFLCTGINDHWAYCFSSVNLSSAKLQH